MSEPDPPLTRAAARAAERVPVEPVPVEPAPVEPGPADPAAPAEPAPAEPVTAEPAPSVAAHVEAASPDVVLPGALTALPGEHRGGFTTPPTAPVPMALIEAHPWEPDAVPVAEPLPVPWRPGVYALVFAVAGLAASLLVGWAFPLGVVGLVLGVVAARRADQRTAGVWAIVLASASLVYSAGWLIYALPRL